MASTLQELGVAGRILIDRLKGARKTGMGPDPAQFATDFTATLNGADVKCAKVLDVPSNQPPWLDSGIHIEAGDEITFITTGRTVLNGPLNVWVPANFQIWGKIGEAGPVFRGARNTLSFTAKSSGTLYLASYFPGEWKTPDGQLADSVDPADYQGLKGNQKAGLIVWKDTAEAGLAGLSPTGVMADLVAAESKRLSEGEAMPPKDWSYLWYLGPGEIFTVVEDGTVGCHTHGNVGILRTDVDAVLTPSLRLCWSWLIEELPSMIREDTVPSHDYLSIAVEYDNGQDITYHWSKSLPAETIYTCPLPTWKDKETHIVIRSGLEGLGEWVDEDRGLRQDYVNALGETRGPVPQRVVRVWLIANSLFQRGTGRCQFRDMRLVDNNPIVPVRAHDPHGGSALEGDPQQLALVGIGQHIDRAIGADADVADAVFPIIKQDPFAHDLAVFTLQPAQISACQSADQKIAVPVGKHVPAIDREARGRNRRHPIVKRVLIALQRLVGGDLGTGIIHPGRHHRPAIIGTTQQQIHFIAAARAMFMGEDAAAINGKPLHIAVAHGEDFGQGPLNMGIGVGAGRDTIFIDADDLAQMIVELLRLFPVAEAIAQRQDDRLIGQKADLAAIMNRGLLPRLGHKDHRLLRQRAILQHRFHQMGGVGIIIASRIAEIKCAGGGKIG